MVNPFADLLWTLRCLTTVPLGGGGRAEPASAALVAVWFPVVGALLGIVGGEAAAWAASWAPPMAAAALALILNALLTGGLHLDGLADTADGVFGGWTPERRLEIMRDSRVGSFGVVALVLVLLLKCGALSALCRGGASWRAAFAWAMAAMFSRCAMVLCAGLAPYARPEGGTGRGFIDRLQPGHAALSMATAFAILWGAVAAPLLAPEAPRWLAAGVLAMAAAVGLTLFLRAKLGGVTGDALGAVGECVEALVLVAAALPPQGPDVLP